LASEVLDSRVASHDCPFSSKLCPARCDAVRINHPSSSIAGADLLLRPFAPVIGKEVDAGMGRGCAGRRRVREEERERMEGERGGRDVGAR